MEYKKGALSFFKVIYQIWRLHEQKIDDLNPILSKITRPIEVAAIKSLRFALLVVILGCILPGQLPFEAAHHNLIVRLSTWQNDI